MMAPSRGFLHFQHSSRKLIKSRSNTTNGARRTFLLSTTISKGSNEIQSYISRSTNPYVNLSIEHHLLLTSPPSSTILFLYTNRPSIIIGRNQNPWYEVNLSLLSATKSHKAIGNIDLVRRRSGGGAVFHDEGNVNWSVICPPANFTRDKHAEMVVRALRKLGVDRARVNKRHDIVLDQGQRRSHSDPLDTHKTPYTVSDDAGPLPLKVSGSAYKLTRTRALHHGTCLLSSPNLHIIPQYLHSPAKPYLKARGVESVSSPIGNIGLGNKMFEKHIQEEFTIMYCDSGHVPNAIVLGDEQLNVPEIRKGYEELKTMDWIYAQTPQFTFSSHPENGDGSEIVAAPRIIPSSCRISFKVQHGVITESLIEGPDQQIEQLKSIEARLQNQKLQDIRDWNKLVLEKNEDSPDAVAIAKWLGRMLPISDIG